MPTTLKVRVVTLLIAPSDYTCSSAQEPMIVCNSLQKPLMLFHLVHPIGATNALAFTKSAESTLRLGRLFEFFE